MASKTFYVPNFFKGYFMTWNMNTQAAFKITVKLEDSSKTYVNNSDSSTNIDPPLAQGNSMIAGDNLKLTVSVPQSSELKASINSYNITRDDGMIVGYGFNLCLEDSNDNDYNDLYVSMACWKTKG